MPKTSNNIPTHYDTLGIQPNAKLSEIKKAYRKLAMANHPDKQKADNDAKMKELNAAYEVLSNPDKRRRYDMSLVGPAVFLSYDILQASSIQAPGYNYHQAKYDFCYFVASEYAKYTASHPTVQRRPNDLRFANLSGANLGAIDIWAADFGSANLKGAKIGDARLSYADFRHACLEQASLQGTYLKQADLQHANLRHANLQNVDLHYANLAEANLENVHLEDTVLWEAILQGAHLEGAQILNGTWWYANLRDAHLENAHVRGTALVAAELQNANLQNTQLYGVNLERANLMGAHLEGAKFGHIRFRGWGWVTKRASLVEANLSGAHLEGADLRSVDLTDARLEGASIDGHTKIKKCYRVIILTDMKTRQVESILQTAPQNVDWNAQRTDIQGYIQKLKNAHLQQNLSTTDFVRYMDALIAVLSISTALNATKTQDEKLLAITTYQNTLTNVHRWRIAKYATAAILAPILLFGTGILVIACIQAGLNHALTCQGILEAASECLTGLVAKIWAPISMLLPIWPIVTYYNKNAFLALPQQTNIIQALHRLIDIMKPPESAVQHSGQYVSSPYVTGPLAATATKRPPSTPAPQPGIGARLAAGLSAIFKGASSSTSATVANDIQPSKG